MKSELKFTIGEQLADTGEFAANTGEFVCVHGEREFTIAIVRLLTFGTESGECERLFCITSHTHNDKLKVYLTNRTCWGTQDH